VGGVDFPTWFGSGYYGGMACCMLAIASTALYTAWCKRGSTQQLAIAIISCVLSALFLLPALFWFNLRFLMNSSISGAEIEIALGYVAVWGWFLPLGVSSGYCLYSAPRSSITAMRIPKQKRTTKEDPAARKVKVPHYQPGMTVPLVYNEYTPWGWLEYRSGSFHGQRLELKRAIITMGRDENCDIWIDDEMASRHHAELAWYQENVYLSDCDSLNGVLLNGQRIHESSLLKVNDLIEIGAYKFTFALADQKQRLDEQNDPLAHHTWRSVEDLMGGESGKSFSTESRGVEGEVTSSIPPSPPQSEMEWQETEKLSQPPIVQERLGGLVVVREGEMAGQTFLLDRPTLTVGRGIECDIILNDNSISRQHVQLLRQGEGDYVQDLSSRNGTKVNGELLQSPRRLQSGDRIQVGNIQLEYAVSQTLEQKPVIVTPPPLSLGRSGPIPLRLPSRQKNVE
jgi:pSer/pThr/pTyr-binding forkhead associated (FHA) protein